jgi:hypothetical protein
MDGEILDKIREKFPKIIDGLKKTDEQRVSVKNTSNCHILTV